MVSPTHTIDNEEDRALYSKAILDVARNPQYFGRMNDPTGSSVMQGLCGDTIEFYIYVKKERIEDVRFYTKGCISTIVCGEIVAKIAMKKPVDKALSISPQDILAKIGDLPYEKNHCAILAVTSFYAAIADYLLKP